MAIKKSLNLKNKKILITAGPTWVPIDNVRVISNVATGETGILLAESLQRLGARVTLLLGPAGCCGINKKISLIRFKFFDELLDLIKKELKTGGFDAVVHTAAVSDYKPAVKYGNKVKSGKPAWSLNLLPTPKIIDLIKKIDRSVYLIGFKFDPKAKKEILIRKARMLIRRSSLDLAVANSSNKGCYEAFVLGSKGVQGPYLNKKSLVQRLSDTLGENL